MCHVFDSTMLTQLSQCHTDFANLLRSLRCQLVLLTLYLHSLELLFRCLELLPLPLVHLLRAFELLQERNTRESLAASLALPEACISRECTSDEVFKPVRGAPAASPAIRRCPAEAAKQHGQGVIYCISNRRLVDRVLGCSPRPRQCGRTPR